MTISGKAAEEAIIIRVSLELADIGGSVEEYNEWRNVAKKLIMIVRGEK